MSDVTIRTLRENENVRKFSEQFDAILDEIRQRAFSLFEGRGYQPGFDFDDWLAAEGVLLMPSPAELIETDKEFRVRVATPGFKAEEIVVNALPQTIVVHAESAQQLKEQGAEVRFSDFGNKKLYRRLELPAPIDLDKITATLVNGILRLTAVKSTLAGERKIDVTAKGHAA
jgi:HSP20 family molecular chaperone IbpA